MSKTNIGFLKHGDIFQYKCEMYRVGNVIEDTNGYVSCTNIKTHKVVRLYIDTEVEVLDNDK